MLPVRAPGGIVFRIFMLQIPMVAHFPVAEEHLIEVGDKLAGERPLAQQQVGGTLGALELAAKNAVKRHRLQLLTKPEGLSFAAFGEGSGRASAVQTGCVSLGFAMTN
jgi:hypothetical protein